MDLIRRRATSDLWTATSRLIFKSIPEDKYETILETLQRLGYQQRKIKIGETPFTMQIDFLEQDRFGGDLIGEFELSIVDMNRLVTIMCFDGRRR
jgi:hypothetical protein